MWALFPETKGRTLEEMDEYFRTTHWFVPLAKVEDVQAGEREAQLVEGKYPGMGDAIPASRKEDVANEKANGSIEENESI